MNRANMLGQIAIALIDEGAILGTDAISNLCQAMPCSTTDCDTCPFDSIHNFNQFKQDYQNG